MARAICRCGESLSLPTDGHDRIVCPKCGARVRIRKPASGNIKAALSSSSADGFIRFFCPCGRRLKVSAAKPPTHGKCPDCDRVVPVPLATAPQPGHPEADTEELNTTDRDMLDRWARGHLGRSANVADSSSAPTPVVPQAVVSNSAQPYDRAEVGLRVCPQCGKPVHLGAEACRSCGTPVPRR